MYIFLVVIVFISTLSIFRFCYQTNDHEWNKNRKTLYKKRKVLQNWKTEVNRTKTHNIISSSYTLFYEAIYTLQSVLTKNNRNTTEVFTPMVSL